jgi:peroxiredoxin
VLRNYVFFPALARQGSEQRQRPGTLTSLGQAAPDFTVTTIEGKTVRLADLRGRVVLVNFFATWCGACRLEFPDLKTIWNDYQGHDEFAMLVIGLEEATETIRAFKDEKGLTFPLAADADWKAYERFATERIPRTYLISRNGKIIYQCVGFYPEEMLSLKTLLKEELGQPK